MRRLGGPPRHYAALSGAGHDLRRAVAERAEPAAATGTGLLGPAAAVDRGYREVSHARSVRDEWPGGEQAAVTQPAPP